MESVLTKTPMNTGMTHNKPFRSFIQHSDNDLLIFGTDNFSQLLKDKMTLSEMIVKNPAPILEVISKLRSAPVYVPWFSGRMEKVAANILGGNLFGSSESLTRTYNDNVYLKDNV